MISSTQEVSLQELTTIRLFLSKLSHLENLTIFAYVHCQKLKNCIMAPFAAAGYLVHYQRHICVRTQYCAPAEKFKNCIFVSIEAAVKG